MYCRTTSNVPSKLLGCTSS